MGRTERRAPERKRVHVLVFDEPEATVGAVRRLRGEGFEVADVHSPFPLHGVEEALSLRPTRIALATLVGGLVGGIGKLGFQGWVHVVDWPMNIGGKPDTALPALVPVTFEITVLVAAFATLGALFLRRRLFPRLVPAPAPRQPHPRVTDDRFAVLVVERDASFAPDRFRRLCEALGPVEVVEDWRVA
jgi:hypothetical protein